MKEIEISAKTIDGAIEEGLAKLGVEMDQVNLEVISNGGMFKKAKIKLTIKENVSVKHERIENRPAPAQPKQEPKKQTEPVATAKNFQEPKKQQERPREKQPPKETQASQTKRDATPITPPYPPKVDTCVKFLDGLLSKMENTCTLSVQEDERAYTININGGDVARLIGRGGDNMNALQSLVSAVATGHSKNDQKRIEIDIENYRERRQETLLSIAQKKVEFVKRTGKTVKLEFMNSRDRATIHTALQETQGIRTYSVGDGNLRRLCIAPSKASSN